LRRETYLALSVWQSDGSSVNQQKRNQLRSSFFESVF